MAGITAYESASQYDLFQSLRPDYTRAIDATISAAKRHVAGKSNICIADFCGGTGTNVKRLAQELKGIGRVAIVDNNAKFLATALTSNIRTKYLDVHQQDVLTVNFGPEFDIVKAEFAYHHIEDIRKPQFPIKVSNSLKPDGALILTEIYLESPKLCIEYYQKLFDSIPKELRVPGLEEFIMQTAKSTDYEFKVGKKFAEKQFAQAGLVVVEEQKIWPRDNSMKPEQGTFVQVLVKSRQNLFKSLRPFPIY